METQVVYQLRSEFKNAKMSIIQYLIHQGVKVDSIQCSSQELKFISTQKLNHPDEEWSNILNQKFGDKIQFYAKRPSGFQHQ